MSRGDDPFPGYTHVWDRRPIGDGTFTVVCVPSRAAIMPLAPNEKTKISAPKRPTALIPPKGGGATQKADDAKAQKAAEARQRPGGPGLKKPRVTAVPELPKVSVPRSRAKRSSNAFSAVGIVLAVLFVLGIVVQYGATILAAITTTLTIAALVAIVVGLAWVAWSTRDADVWQRVPAWLEQRRVARVELEQRRVEVAELVERDQPIALGPVTTVDTVSTVEHVELMKRWTPGTHVPELAPEWRR